jgi:hypothetical protein
VQAPGGVQQAQQELRSARSWSWSWSWSWCYCCRKEHGPCMRGLQLSKHAAEALPQHLQARRGHNNDSGAPRLSLRNSGPSVFVEHKRPGSAAFERPPPTCSQVPSRCLPFHTSVLMGGGVRPHTAPSPLPVPPEG